MAHEPIPESKTHLKSLPNPPNVSSNLTPQTSSPPPIPPSPPASPASPTYSNQPLFTNLHPLAHSTPSSPSTLFRAIHTASATPVVVKTYLKRDLARAANGALLTRVAVEREALARLTRQGLHTSSPSVPPAPPLLAATHDNTAVALIMRLAEGPRAADLARSCHGDEDRAANVIRICVNALEAVHEARVLHLDLTLENIVVAPGGATFVDFGSAALEDVAEVGRDYAATVSRDVLPPELIEGDVVPTRAADVWALGVAAFRMLHGGERLFCATGDGDYKAMEKIVTRRAGDELPFADGISKDAADFVQSCLHPTPRKRLGVVGSTDGKPPGFYLDYDQIRGHPFLKPGLEMRASAAEIGAV